MTPRIKTSKRWRKSYSAASLRFQANIEGAVQDLVRLIRSDPSAVKRQYGRVKGLSSSDVLEVKISGGDRMCALYEGGQVTLLAVGKHVLPDEYNNAQFKRDRGSATAAAIQKLWPETTGFFLEASEPWFANHFAHEDDRDWVYTLSDSQESVFTDVGADILDDPAARHLVIGGPGTGKTCVLVKVLKELVDSGWSPEDLCVVTPIQVKEYLMACFPDSRLDEYVVDTPRPAALVLWDDPDTLSEVRTWAVRNPGTGLVLAFDPLQLDGSLKDSEYDAFRAALGAEHHVLTECYRQREKVGKQTRRVIETVGRSTPFLDEGKIRKFRKSRHRLTELSNNIAFVNPAGHVKVLPQPTVEEMLAELEALPGRALWSHWSPFLLATEDGIKVPRRLRKYLKRHGVFETELGSGDEKGTEFQHAVVVISKQTFDELESGFSGSGRSAFTTRTRMRIPFSRPKDSIVIIVR